MCDRTLRHGGANVQCFWVITEITHTGDSRKYWEVDARLQCQLTREFLGCSNREKSENR